MVQIVTMTETPHDKLSVSRDNHPTSVQKDVEERKPEAVEDGNAGHGQLSAKNEVEYVTGWRFIAIAIAIVLSMFLVRSCSHECCRKRN